MTDSQAIILLCLRTEGSDGAAPLTPGDYDRLAAALQAGGQRPSHLFSGAPVEAGLPAERLRALLERGPAVAVLLERWTQSGLWVMTRADPDYPMRWKPGLADNWLRSCS